MEKKLFLGANTADGLVHFFADLIKMYGLEKLYILKGGSGVGKSTFINKFAEAFNNGKNDITYFYCSGDPQSLDGAVIENLGIGIVDGTHPHPLDPQYPGIIDEIINLGQFIDPTKVTATKESIDEINNTKRKYYKKAFEYLHKARDTHYLLESHYKKAVDFDAVNALLEQIIRKAAAVKKV